MSLYQVLDISLGTHTLRILDRFSATLRERAHLVSYCKIISEFEIASRQSFCVFTHGSNEILKRLVLISFIHLLDSITNVDRLADKDALINFRKPLLILFCDHCCQIRLLGQIHRNLCVAFHRQSSSTRASCRVIVVQNVVCCLFDDDDTLF